MTDEFERFLAAALSPAEREPDLAFVRRVQARIALDERLAAERRAMLSALALKSVAIAVFAAALAWFGRSPAVGELAADAPAILLAILLAGFSFLLLLLRPEPLRTFAPLGRRAAFQQLSRFSP